MLCYSKNLIYTLIKYILTCSYTQAREEIYSDETDSEVYEDAHENRSNKRNVRGRGDGKEMGRRWEGDGKAMGRRWEGDGKEMGRKAACT